MEKYRTLLLTDCKPLKIFKKGRKSSFFLAFFPTLLTLLTKTLTANSVFFFFGQKSAPSLFSFLLWALLGKGEGKPFSHEKGFPSKIRYYHLVFFLSTS